MTGSFTASLRLLAVTTARESLPVENPEVVRLLAGLGWRLERRLRPGRAADLLREATESFGASPATAESMAREAHDVALQARLEELILPRMPRVQLGRYVVVDGEVGGGSLVVMPRAGNPLLGVAALAWRLPGLVVVQEPPTAHAPPAAQRLARRFEAEQSRLPVLWEPNPASIAAHLREGRVVVVFPDDRFLPERVDVPLLGGVAHLSPAPWDAARAVGAPIVPAYTFRQQDKTWRLDLATPRAPVLATWAAESFEPWLRSHGAQWLVHLAECRFRGARVLG